MQKVPQNNDRYLKAICQFWQDSENIDLELLQNPDFITFCSEHRVLLMLTQQNRFPKITDHNLRQTILQLQIAQLKLIQALITIQDAFANADIPCIHLKGPVLSQLLYQKPDFRQSKDLDIWVHFSDLDKAIAVLESQSFKAQVIWKTPKQKKAIIKHYHSLEFVKENSEEHVELHWRLPELNDLAFNAAPTNDVIISSHRFRALNKDALYRYLCNHGAKHAYYRLFWLFDIQHMRQIDPSLKNQPGQPGWLLEKLALESGNQLLATPIEQESYKELMDHTCLYIHNPTFKSRWKKLLRYHRLNYLNDGFPGLCSSLIGRNVRPENWKYFVFPDSMFFLNQLFSRVIWLIRLILKK